MMGMSTGVRVSNPVIQPVESVARGFDEIGPPVDPRMRHTGTALRVLPGGRQRRVTT
jgi:hypothetical protein